MNKGTVKWFNSQKGYGFITNEENGRTFSFIFPELPPMASSLWKKARPLHLTLQTAPRGLQAVNVCAA